jgi:hypothetical protein
MTRRRLLAFCAILALLISMPLPATAAGGARHGARPHPERFRSVQQAVGLGVVDAGIAAALRGGGHVDAIVTFDYARVLAPALKQAPTANGRSAAVLAAARPGFARQKAVAIARAGTGAKILETWENLGASFVRISSMSALLRLVQGGEVTGVRVNHVRQLQLEESLPLIRRDASSISGQNGTGTSVAVLDTGADFTRDAFGNCTSPGVPAGTCKVRYAADFAAPDGVRDGGLADCENGAPDYCHGTNVSGIVLGVAPDTRILALDVFQGGGAPDAATSKAMNWIVANQATYNIRAANLSLGSPDYNTKTCWNDSFAAGFASLRAVNVLPVVASGNAAADGPGGAFTNGVASPACAPGALSVGAMYDSDIYPTQFSCQPVGDHTAANEITCFSQSGPTLGLLAPGALITAADVTQGGTSQATPHVAGAAAVLAAAHPTAVPYQIETILKTSGPSLTDTRNGVARRRLDLVAALAKAVPARPMWGADPELVVGSRDSATWTWGGSLAQTLSGAIRWFHNAHTNVMTSNYGVEYTRSRNNGASWEVKRLNPTTRSGDWVSTASSGAYVYVLWMDWANASPFYRTVNFRANSNHGAGGTSWLASKVISPATQYSDGPAIAAAGTNVYVVWTDLATRQVRFRRSTNRGGTWGPTVVLGTTTAIDTALGPSGNISGMANVAAVGTNVAVSFRTTNAGALVTRISANSGSSFGAATSLDGNSNDGARIAAYSNRFVYAWTDPTGVRIRERTGTAWGAVRTVGAFSSSGTYKRGYDAAVAITGTGTTEVVWSACRLTGCAQGSSQGTDLLWRRSTDRGVTWPSVATIIFDSRVSPIQRINDGADIEFSTASRRHVAWSGYTNPDPDEGGGWTATYFQTGG